MGDKLTGLDRLNALTEGRRYGGASDSNTEKLTGMDRLNALTGLDPLANIRTTQAATPEDLETEINDLTTQYRHNNVRLQAMEEMSAPYVDAISRFNSGGNEWYANLKRLEDDVYNATGADRQRALKQYQVAANGYANAYQRAVQASDWLKTNVQPMAAEVGTQNEAIAEGFKARQTKYVEMLAQGDEQAKEYLRQAEEYRKQADDAYRHAQVTAPYLRKAEEAERAAAEAQQRYAQYLYSTEGEDAAQEYLNGTRQSEEKTGFVNKVLNTIGGTAANFFSGFAGNPWITLARLMELPDDILYAVTKDERFNLDREPYLRDSEALRASDTFAQTAQELGETAGWLGKQIVNTGYAAGNMLSSAAIAGMGTQALANTGLVTKLEGVAESSPLLTSPAARRGAKLALDVLKNPGNLGVSAGSAVNSYSEALANGASFSQAVANGLYKGLTEYVSNKMFSGTPLEDLPGEKGYVTKAIEAVSEALGKSEALKTFNETTGGKVAAWLFDKAGEGMEEVITGILDPIIDRASYSIETNWLPELDNLVDEFIGGMLLSLLMTGGEAALKPGMETAQIRDQLQSMGYSKQDAAKFAPEIRKALKAAESVNEALIQAQGDTGEARQTNEAQENNTETGPTAEARTEVPASQQSNALTQAVDRLNAGEELSGQVARAILADETAMQMLRDAGLLPERVLNDSSGRTAVLNAVQEYAAQSKTQETLANQPNEAKLRIYAAQEQQGGANTLAEESAQQRAAEGPQASRLTLPTVETNAETQDGGSQKSGLTLPTVGDTVNENNRQEANNGQREETPAARLSFREQARQIAGQQNDGGSGRRSGLGRFLEAFRANRESRRARSGAERILRERSSEITRIQNALEAGDLGEEISGLDLGMEDGTDKKTATLLTDSVLTTDMKEAVRLMADRGWKLLFGSGMLETTDKYEDGTHVMARAFVNLDTKTVYVQADHHSLSWAQLLDHEELHREINEDPGLRKEIEDALLADKRLAPYLSEIIDRYAAAYAKIGITNENEVIEEMLCDYRAGFDMLDLLGTEGYMQKAQTAKETIRAAEQVRAENKAPNVAAAERAGATVIPETSEHAQTENITDALAEGDIQDATRHSYEAIASAGGFVAVEKDGERYFVGTNGERIRKVTSKQIMESPIGTLINYAAEQGWLGETEEKNKAAARQQAEFFADILTLAATNQDFAMSMNMVGAVAFTAIKANADHQYKTTYDFKSICIKTQAVINNMSAAMVAKRGALTKAEILDIYKATAADGLPVPCPECYVFSRWIGIGGLLDNIWKYQNHYGKMTPQEVVEAREEAFKKITQEMEELNASLPADKQLTFGKARGKLRDSVKKEYNKLREKIELADNTGTAVSDTDQVKLKGLESMMSDVNALTWIDDVYFGGKAASADNVNPKFRVPADILFDLNMGGKFATEYADAWGFRTTQGAGYGKAITPFAQATLGEGILGVAGLSTTIKNKAAGKLKNPFLDARGEISKTVRAKLNAAVANEKTQLFRGGQRFSSTSDMSNDVASDLLIAMLEMQTMHAGVQMYTKVDGAVGPLTLMGAFVNQSLMPLGGGFKNGEVADTSVGGMNPKVAFANREKYDRAGTITIGVNDNHIRAMFRQVARDFIIPYHASGGDANLVGEMRTINDPGEAGTKTRSTDYTRTQGEKIMTDNLLRSMGKTEEEIERIEQTRAARIAILTRSKTGPNMEVVRSNPILSALYDKFNGGEWDGVKLTKDEVEHFIYPNEFWDTTVDYEHSGRNSQLYLDYCEALGFLHRFSGQIQQAKGDVTVLKATKGYDENGNEVPLTDLAYVYDEDGNKTDQIEDYFWKVLVDRRMYGNDGKYIPQTAISLSSITTGDIVDFAKHNAGRQYDEQKSQALVEKIRGVFEQYRHNPEAIAREVQKLINENKQEEQAGEERLNGKNDVAKSVKFSREVRPEVVERLDKQMKDGDYVIVYHSMYQDKNGKLYSPMAGKKKVGDEWVMTDPTDLNAWYKSDTPESIADLIENGSVRLKDNGKWSFYLKKPEGGSPVPAALNPWNHASTDALNDQFTSAYERENGDGELVTVECIIPLSEVDPTVAVDPVTGEVTTTPYEETGMVTDRDVTAKPDPQNKKLKLPTAIPAGTTIEAKDSVGLKMWKAGPVHGQISGKRPVYLSRWIRNTRVLSTEETARMIAKTLKDEGFKGEIPGNVVGLKLRQALETQGVKFGKPQSSVAKNYYAYMAEQGYTREQANGEKLGEGKASLEIDPKEAALATQTRLKAREARAQRRGGGKEISRVRSNTFELSGLYNQVERQMQETQPEEFSYDPISEKKSMQEALGRLRSDFDGEVEKLSTADQWGGSDLDTAMGILHQYRRIGRETGDYSLFNDWSHVIQEKGTKGGQFIQAFAKYSRTATERARKAAENLRDAVGKLTPAEQKRIQEHVNEILGAIDSASEQAAQDAVSEAKGGEGLHLPNPNANAERMARDAENVIREIYEIFSKKDHGPEVENWMKLSGEELAKRISARMSNQGKGNSQRTVMQTIIGDLYQFAQEHVPQGNRVSTPRTAIERISDYMNNRGAYAEAWNEAKQVLREMYAGDQNKLEALEAFINSTLSYNSGATDAVMYRAILESADALGISKKDILNRAAVGPVVTQDLIEDIADEFIRQVGTDDGTLRDTVYKFINGIVVEEGQQKLDARLTRMEQAAAKELDIKLQKLLRESRQTKMDAANRIAQYLINDLGISLVDATIAANHIAQHYMDRINLAADKALQKMFEQNGEKLKAKQRDKLMDLIHLGGLTNSNVEDAVVDALGLGKLSRAEQRRIMDDMSRFADTLDAIEANDLEGLRQLIREQAAVRGTKLDRLAEKVLSGETDAEYLRSLAMAQLDLIAADFRARTAGEKISAVQVISHLLNARTAMRNLTSNQVFDLVASAANNMSLLPDIIMSKLTGQRTVGLNKSWLSQQKRQGATKGAARGYLEVTLDAAPTDRNLSKYGTGGRRTFTMANSGTAGKILSQAERILGYELNTTDEFHKGSVMGETLESLARFVERGDMTEDEAAEFAAQEALYRSFQDSTLVGTILGGLKDVLNLVGVGKTNGKTIKGLPVHDFGLGDLVTKYTQVPGAFVHRAIEFSPVGYLKAIYNIAQLANVRHKGESTLKAQRNAALALGRATTGTGLITLFLLLAKAGLLRRGDDEKDKNAAAIKASQGLSGTQLNVSAIGRVLSGESAAPQDGDVLADIGFLEPLDSLMTIASLIENDPEIGGLNIYDYFHDPKTALTLSGKSLQGIWLALEDTSAMQTLSNIYSTVRYHDEANDLPLYMQIPIEIAASNVSGFVPAPVRQLAQATDTTYRDQYRSQDLLAQTGAKVANAIPGLRQQLAPKITPLGEDKKYQAPVLNALNALLSPGNISVYQSSKVTDEVLRVYEATGEKNVLPERNAPYTLTLNKSSHTLTPDERTEYQQTRGSAYARFVKDVKGSDWYSDGDVDLQANVLKWVQDFTDYIAKRRFSDSRDLGYTNDDYEGYYQQYLDGEDPADIIADAKHKTIALAEAGMNADERAEFSGLSLAEQKDYLLDAHMSDQKKLSALGAVLGTEMTTPSGAPSQWAQVNAAVDDGVGVDKAIQMMQDKTLDDYMVWRESDCRKAGIDADTYIQFKVSTNKMDGKDANGKSVSGEKKRKVLEYIDSLNLTVGQKDALYYAMNYAESTLNEAPWHTKASGGGKKLNAPTDLSRLVLPTEQRSSQPRSGLVLPSR